MRKITFLLTVCAFVLSFSAVAQQGDASISGLIHNNDDQPVAAATISLLKLADSSLVKMSVTNEQGEYDFDAIVFGHYLLRVSAVGHISQYSKPVKLGDGFTHVVMPTLKLVKTADGLEAVTVTASKPMIEQKIDRMVVNVDAAVTNQGATALEVLEKSPGITVDKDGNISLKGKQGVTVMIDGRPAYLSGEELTNYLRNMPASSLEQVEIMTNPSARYDAAGNAGIINLRTKKDKKRGFNGNLTLGYGQGKYWSVDNSLYLNYRTSKLNLFANAGYNERANYQELNISRTFSDPETGDPNAYFEQVSFLKRHNGYYSLKLGADYFVSPKTTVGVTLKGFLNPEDTKTYNTSHILNSEKVLDSTVIANSTNSKDWQNMGLNVYFTHQIDSSGRELTGDLDLVQYSAASDLVFETTSYDPSQAKQNALLMDGDLPVDISIYAARLDYTQPVFSTIKLETGVKGSYVETDNMASYFTVNGASRVPDYDKTNHFTYREKIGAAYVNLNGQFGKWGVQAGLRYEHTYYEGLQSGNPQREDSSFSRDYGSLFPTTFVSFTPNDKNQWALSYGRRIDRPRYQDMNPFLFFLDQFTYEAGNPFLQPQFSDNVELSHTYKGFLTTTVNYGHTRNYISEVFRQGKAINSEEDNASIISRGNIGKYTNAGIAMSVQWRITSWWMSVAYANLNYNAFSGPLNGEMVNVEATNVLFNLNNQFRFKKGWQAELSGFYRSKGVEGQIVIRPLGQLSMGVSKKVLKEKGSIKLSVRDLLYTQQPKGDINFQYTKAHFENYRDTRRVSLTFSWRFGKPLKNAPKNNRRERGAEAEQGRVGVGN